MTLRTKANVFCGMLLTVALTLCGAIADAGTINVGTIELAPQADQQVEFFVTGTDVVAGMEFDIQVGDGGSDLGGSDTRPVITAIDLITGTIFQTGTNPNQVDVVTYPLARQSTVDITDTLTADGKIATVTFDASGMTPGTEILLRLSGVASSFDTRFFNAQGNPVLVSIQNGSITITPEPAVLAQLLALLGMGGLGLFFRRRKQRAG